MYQLIGDILGDQDLSHTCWREADLVSMNLLMGFLIPSSAQQLCGRDPDRSGRVHDSRIVLSKVLWVADFWQLGFQALAFGASLKIHCESQWDLTQCTGPSHLPSLGDSHRCFSKSRLDVGNVEYGRDWVEAIVLD